MFNLLFQRIIVSQDQIKSARSLREISIKIRTNIIRIQYTASPKIIYFYILVKYSYYLSNLLSQHQ